LVAADIYMADPLDEILYPLECPKCRQEFQVALGRLENAKKLPCPKCRTRVDLTSPERARDIAEWLDRVRRLRNQRNKKP
jgi:hydrogenase maturation factor HypF (carbamoyltransferase family)